LWQISVEGFPVNLGCLAKVSVVLTIGLRSVFGIGGEAKIVVIDVRTPAEYSRGHVVGALNLDFSSATFKSEIAKLDRAKTYKLYCAVGGRSGKAAAIMQEMKFEHVENLGGIADAADKLKAKCEGPKGCSN
jgi:rhodanese-related sulfurtransferase